MATDTRVATIAAALAQAARQQGVVRVADLDFTQLATTVAALTGAASDPPTTPLDPEGDGLTPPEFNAANDG